MKDKNLIVKLLIGIPASGKSTWVNEFIKKNSNWVCVNRDAYRYMLKGVGWCEPKIEDMITKMVDDAILLSLSKRLNVIVDQTNVKPKYVNHFIELVKYVADVEFMVFDISFDKALERDKNRERSVGVDVLKKMWKDYRGFIETFDTSIRRKQVLIKSDLTNWDELPEAVIFDLDGTLAFNNGMRGYFDWDKVDRDAVSHTVREQVILHEKAGDTIIILTGRDGAAKEMSEEWLKFYNIPYHRIFTRKEGDFRKDTIVKEEIYREHIYDKFFVKIVYEDRKKVVDMWRSLGLKCFQVEEGMF